LPILLCFAVAVGAAQERPRLPSMLTLRQAIEMALRHGPLVEAAQARADQSSARARAARSLSLPRATFTARQSDQTDNLRAYGLTTPLLDLNTSPFSTFDARIDVSYDIWDPSRSNRQKALQLEADASTRDQEQARAALIAEVADAFLTVCYGQEVQLALKSQSENAAALLQIAQERYDKGTGSAIEPNRATQEARRVQMLQLDAAASLQRAKTTLARLLNAQIGTAFDAAEPETGGDLPAAEAATQIALTSRPDYSAALARVESAKAASAAMRAKRLPAAQLHADSGFNGTSPVRGIVTYRVFGAIELPLFHAEQSPEESEAESRLRETRAAAEDLKATVEAEVNIAHTEVSAAQQKGAVASEIRDLARQELELASRRLTAGVTDNTEVLAAQERLLHAEEDVARTRFEIRSHRTTLYLKMGRSEEIYAK
jgi:outer membrane protein TolC